MFHPKFERTTILFWSHLHQIWRIHFVQVISWAWSLKHLVHNPTRAHYLFASARCSFLFSDKDYVNACVVCCPISTLIYPRIASILLQLEKCEKTMKWTNPARETSSKISVWERLHVYRPCEDESTYHMEMRGKLKDLWHFPNREDIGLVRVRSI